MRKAVSWNDSWSFHKTEEPEQIVSLPHCYNTVDGQDGSAMYRGLGIYQKTLEVTEEELQKYLFLEVGAAELGSTVEINGEVCYQGQTGFSLYRVFMNPYLKTGANEIQITVTNEVNSKIYPAMADFSFYGGLYREVRIISDEAVHFSETDGSRDGVILETSCSEDLETGLLKADLHICSEEANTEAVLQMIVRSREGSIVASQETTVMLPEKTCQDHHLEVMIPEVHLWDGVADPYLYDVELTIRDSDNVILDTRALSVGFRTLSYDKTTGFLLNGHPYKLHGVAKHQDFWAVGNAITQEHLQKDLELILEMGANAVRCSHYQHCDEWYQLCDRAGLLVWAEIPVISAVPQKEASDENAKEQLHLLISQVRNHTSVFCWGVQNECCMISKNTHTFRLTDELAKLCKAMDPSRMTAQANEYTTEDDCPILGATEILGWNFYYGWYYGTIPELQERLDSAHEAAPEKPMILSEYGVDANPRFHSAEPKANDYTEEYQLMFHENAICAIEERPFMMGGFVWNMFDFGSAGRDEGGRKGQNQKGLVTIDRKTRKDAFYLYKAHWSAEPFVYITGRRFVNRAQEETDLMVLGRTSRMRLLVNGIQIETRENCGPITVFRNIALKPGENKIRVETCVGTCVGTQEGCSDEIRICRVEQADESYILPVKNTTQNAINWFEGLDPETMERVEEKPLRPEGYSFEDTVADLFDNPDTRAVFLKYLSPITEGARFSPSAPMPVSMLLRFAGRGIPKAILIACEQELNTIDRVDF